MKLGTSLTDCAALTRSTDRWGPGTNSEGTRRALEKTGSWVDGTMTGTGAGRAVEETLAPWTEDGTGTRTGLSTETGRDGAVSLGASVICSGVADGAEVWVHGGGAVSSHTLAPKETSFPEPTVG